MLRTLLRPDFTDLFIAKYNEFWEIPALTCLVPLGITKLVDVSEKSMSGQETNETWAFFSVKGVIQGQFEIFVFSQRKPVKVVLCPLLKPREG